MKRLHSALLSAFAVLSGLVLSGCGGPNLVDRMNNPWGWSICGTILVILDILAIIEIAGSNRKFGSKALWTLLIVFFPFVGLVFYYLFGD